MESKNPLGEIYRKQFEIIFRNHPDKDEIIKKLIKGDNDPTLIDLWFEEAEYYSWQKIMNTPKPKPDKNGIVKFEIYKGD